MTKKIIIILIVLLFLAPLFIFADMGMIPYPSIINLDESEQNAIVAWNGEEEALILSTGIKASEDASVLRILPLPANPSKVEEGDFEIFERLVEKINEKIENYWYGRGEEGVMAKGGEVDVEITFHEKIGAHDITVAKVNDLDGFIEWVENYLIGGGLEYYDLSIDFKDTVADYLGRNIKYFVFDLVEAGTASESIKPIIYRFSTDYLYYPIEITATSDVGATEYSEVSIFIITKKAINLQTIYKLNFTPQKGFDYPINFSQEDLTYVNSEIADLFSSGAKVYQVKYYGRLNNLVRDVVLADLIKTDDSPKVYQIIRAKKHWIPSPSAFNEKRFNWTDVEVVRPQQIETYPAINLVRAAGNYKVYHLTEAGLKRHIPSIDVFGSYSYKWEDVNEITATELAGYSENVLIRAEGDYKVYKLENCSTSLTTSCRKRWIKTAVIFNGLGYKWDEIATVNAAEFSAYPEGTAISCLCQAQ